MYNFFDWPLLTHKPDRRNHYELISSQLGLPMMSSRCCTHQPTTVYFSVPTQVFKSLWGWCHHFVVRKVVALSLEIYDGCLDIYRHATKICDFSHQKPEFPDLVALDNLIEAIDGVFSSSYITVIKSIFLLWSRTSSVLSSQCFVEQDWRWQYFSRYTVDMCLCAEKEELLYYPTTSETMALCSCQGFCHLLLVKPSRSNLLFLYAAQHQPGWCAVWDVKETSFNKEKLWPDFLKIAWFPFTKYMELL